MSVRGGGVVRVQPAVGDPYTPPDGTWNVTGAIIATGNITGNAIMPTTGFGVVWSGDTDTGINKPNADHLTLVAGNNNIFGVRWENSAMRIGFFTAATAPVVKQEVTGSRGANAALTSLLTALATYGLITDSSS